MDHDVDITPEDVAPTVAFDVVDVLAGFASLVKRSPTLDGSVPVRVAQGCVPLLEGNAWGWQIQLSRRLELKKKLTGWSVSGTDEIQRMTRASVPMLLGDGTLRPGAWVKRLERGGLETGRAPCVFTGLFVKPRAGWRLRLSTNANRRSWLYRVDEAIYDDTSALTPVFLELNPDANADTLVLDGDVATFGVLPAKTIYARPDLIDAPEVVRAHIDFYNAEYFATKQRGQVARTYRDEIVKNPLAPSDDDTPYVRIVDAGSGLVSPAAPTLFHRPTGPVAAPADTDFDRAVVRNLVRFTATYDGYRLIVEPDRDELEMFAATVRSRWQQYQRETGAQFHDGALLYLTKYVTPHPAGEPHFFVKPPTLIWSSPGTSTVIDGLGGAGFDVMRGVVRTDSFHAVPAVFHLWRPGTTIEVPSGVPLVELFTYPRALDRVTFAKTVAGAGSWSTP